MRTTKKLLFLFIVSILLFSCKDLKDNLLKELINETTTTGVSSKTQFTAKVNGVLLDLSAGNTTSAQKIVVSQASSLNLKGDFIKGIEGQSILIKIRDYKGIGKYALHTNGVTKKENAARYVKITTATPMSSEVWTDIGGEVEIIEEKNDSVSGTFSFVTGKGSKQGDPIHITEGQFNLPITTFNVPKQ